MEKHTPGPLYASKLGNDADQYAVCDEATGRTVAVTHDDEGGRNAAMFAASKDLYTALKWLRETFTDDYCKGLHAHTEWRYATKAADAAIAKATA